VSTPAVIAASGESAGLRFIEFFASSIYAASEVRASNSATIDKNGIRFMLSNLMSWEGTAIKDIEAKVLFRDLYNGMVTQLVRIAPGTSYPRHRHADKEECYVLEGDVTIREWR
jgi:hypothetical protein